MGPKSGSTGKEQLIDDEDEVLQAVILADSFNKRFRPLTSRKPRCLLPICNAPLLDWTFESLSLAGVQEIFVMCRSHAEQVKAAIQDSKWSKPGSGIKIVPILTAKETFSPGDAMRDIYTRGLVTTDFILVTGDLVSNIRIDEVVNVHKERRKLNKDTIMTMVVKESGVDHRSRTRGESSVFVLDSETSECLHYESVLGHPTTTHINVPRELIAEHPSLEIRNDLIDCSIDICSPEVPSLFQDNFDYSDIRRDFVHGILTSDLLMKNIFCYVAKEGYAARVKDTRSYHAVSKDILSRWTFPLVPDDNHPGGHSYEHIRGNKYIPKDNTVKMSRTSKLGNNTLVGSSSQLLGDCSVDSSVIGRSCSIGSGSTVHNSYLFDGSRIGSNCRVEYSIIGANVTVKDNCHIARGCRLDDNVTIGPNVSLKPFQYLSHKRETDGSEEDSDEDSDYEDIVANQASTSEFGTDANIIIWPSGPESDEDEDDPENFKNLRFLRLGENSEDLDLSDGGSETSSSEETDSEEDSDNPINELPETEFQTEVNLSLDRAFAEGHSIDNAAVELKTLRMASNVPISSVRESVIRAIVTRIKLVEGNPQAQRKEVVSTIQRWGELINRIGGVDGGDTVSILQNHCSETNRVLLFGQILAAIYQEDIVEEQDIRTWHSQSRSSGTGLPSGLKSENMKKCWLVGSRMIQQFDEQSESESEDESGSGSGSE